MSFFAWVSIVEAVLKLLVVYLLIISPLDKLVAYVILLTLVSIIVLFCYKIYCNKKFEIAHYKRITDYSLVKEILGFSGWSLFGATANVANQQGTNIVLNMFTNVTVNAAMGIANQVNSAVYSFVSNFQTAFNPQLVKSYAAGEKEKFDTLIIRSAKLSFILMWFIVLPLYLNCEFVLTLWLKNVPKYAVDFVRLILIWSLIESINGPLYMAIQATGKIKFYQIIIGIINLSNLPLVILALHFNNTPLCILYIKIFTNIIALIFRLILIFKYTAFSILNFIKNNIFIPFIIVIVSVIITNSLCVLFNKNMYFFASCLSSVITTGLLFLIIGLTKSERQALKNRLERKL
jgi:O-antigen/teichoic acid export membrane protein